MIDSVKKFYKFQLIFLLSFVVDGLSIIQNIAKDTCSTPFEPCLLISGKTYGKNYCTDNL